MRQIVPGQNGAAFGHAIGPQIVSQGVQTVGVDLARYGLRVTTCVRSWKRDEECEQGVLL